MYFSLPHCRTSGKKPAKEVAMLSLIQKENFVVVQIAPAVRASLGEEYNMPLGTDVTGKLVTGLKRLGFKKVFDTNFAADFTIMEETTELVNRITNKKPLTYVYKLLPGMGKISLNITDPDLLDHVSYL